MSGGHFDYQQYKIDEIANSIEDYIYGHGYDEEDMEYIRKEAQKWIYDDYTYELEHHHSKPNCYDYSEETINKFKEGLDILRRAAIYAQRIDWLLSADDGEDSFHRRLKEDLDEYERKKNGIQEALLEHGQGED